MNDPVIVSGLQSFANLDDDSQFLFETQEELSLPDIGLEVVTLDVLHCNVGAIVRVGIEVPDADDIRMVQLRCRPGFKEEAGSESLVLDSRFHDLDRGSPIQLRVVT